MSGGLYYTDMLDLLVSAGCVVGESDTTDGWQGRARSSGGFPAVPLCVFWHHTASNTTPANDLSYMINGCPDAPVGNMLIDRDGVCWPIAAGASNCAGKSETAKSFSRGTIPVDGGNTRGWQIECANAGVGDAWPSAQVNALFRASNVMNERFGNLPADVITHALGAGDGYTNRKIDPATASAVQGAWVPRSTNSSGTWSLADIRLECSARAGISPAPDPGDDDMPSAAEIAAAVWAHPFSNGAPAQQWLEDTLGQLMMIGPMVTDGEAVWGRQVEYPRGDSPASAYRFLTDILDQCQQIGAIVTDIQVDNQQESRQ